MRSSHEAASAISRQWPGIGRAALALLLIVIAVYLYGAFWLCHGQACDSATADVRILAWMDRHRASSPGDFFTRATALGSLYALVPLSVLWVARRRVELRNRLLGPTALLGASVTVILLKNPVGRPRPDGFASLIPLPDGPSFPSAHAEQAIAFWLAIWLTTGNSTVNKPLLVLTTAVTLAVGLSRIYLQVHYPSDVVAGLIVGIAWVCFARRLMPAPIRSRARR